MAQKKRPRIGDAVEIHECIELGISDRDTIYGIILNKPCSGRYYGGYIYQCYWIYLPEMQGVTQKTIERMRSEAAKELQEQGWRSSPRDCLPPQTIPLMPQYGGCITVNKRETDDEELKVGDLVYDRRNNATFFWEVVYSRYDEGRNVWKYLIVNKHVNQYLYVTDVAQLRNRKELVKLTRRSIRKTNNTKVAATKDIKVSPIRKLLIG